MLATKRLKEVSVEICDKCPLECKHCSSEGSPNNNTFIDTYTLFRLAREGKDLGADVLTISGGEPFLHQGLFEFCSYASTNGYFIKLYTCGILRVNGKICSISSEAFKNLKASGVNALIFSLHGRPARHDYITSYEGTHDLVLESIKRAVRNKFTVEIHTVPMKNNIPDLEYIIDVAEELNVSQVSFLRYVPQGRSNLYGDLTVNKIDYKHFKVIVDKIKDNKQIKVRLGSPYSCLYPGKINFCSAGSNKILIGPSGDAYPCEAFKQLLKGKSSNVYNHSLRDIWLNDSWLNSIRALSVDNISFCHKCSNKEECLGGCHGQRLLANNSLFIGPDPACFRLMG